MGRTFSRLLFSVALTMLISGNGYSGQNALQATRFGTWIRDWLVCGPFPNPLPPGVVEYRHDNTCLGFAKDYLEPVGGETGVSPRPGLRVPAPGGAYRVWKELHLSGDYLDFCQIFSPNQKVVAYAASRMALDRETEAVLALGSNDGVKVWLNGRLVWVNHRPRGAHKDEDLVRLHLRKGSNLVLFKVDQGYGNWGLYARFLPLEQAVELLRKRRPDVELELEASDDTVRVNFGRTSDFLVLDRVPRYVAELRDARDRVLRTDSARLGQPVRFPTGGLPDGPYWVRCRALLPFGKGKVVQERFFFRGRSPVTVRLVDASGAPCSLAVEMLDTTFQTLENATRVRKPGVVELLRTDVSPFYVRALVKWPSLGSRWVLADNEGRGYTAPSEGALEINLLPEVVRTQRHKLESLLREGDLPDWFQRQLKRRLERVQVHEKSAAADLYGALFQLATLKARLAGTSGLTVWYAPAVEKVAAHEPVPAFRLDTVHVEVARGETEAFQVVLRPTRAWQDVRVRISELRTADDRVLSSQNVTLRRVAYVTVNEPTDSYGSADLWPDPLPLLRGPLRLRPGENAPVWVAVWAPLAQTPGLYRGHVEVQSRGQTLLRIPLQVWVLDFALPEEPTVETAYGVRPERRYFGPVSDAQYRCIHDLTMQLCARYRISPYYPHAGSNFTYHFEGDPPHARVDFSAFDSAMARYLDGLHFTTFNLGGLPGELAGHPRGTAEYDRLFGELFGAVQEHLRSKGWLRKGYWYWVDEPPISEYDRVKEGMALLKRACPDVRRLLTCNQEAAPAPEFFGLVNLWVPILDKYDPERAQTRQRLGETVWWYVCTGPKAPYPNNFIDHPAVNHRIRFWMLDRYGVDGSLYWSITYWRQNPWEQAMSVSPSGGNWGNGDGRLLYPPRQQIPEEPVVEAPVPSIRLECLRDGLEDVELLHALRRSGKAKALEVVRRAEAALVPTLTCYEQNPVLLEGWRLVVGRVVDKLGKK